MPKVKISDDKGLVQSSGKGLQIATDTTLNGKSLTGDHKKIKVLSTSTTLTESDSGKLFICEGGDGSSTTTHTFPVGKAGWHGTFMITGSIAEDIILSGAAASSTSAVSLRSNILSGSGLGGILQTGVTDIRFDVSGVESDADRIDVFVLVADSLVAATGFTSE